MPGSSTRLVALMVGLCVLTAGVQLHLYPESVARNEKAPGALLQMKRALVQHAVHPAIFLGGGSNVLTGLRAETISQALHRPVYNLALSNELGDFRASLAFLEQAARSGDVIVYASRGFHADPPLRQEIPATAAGVPASSKMRYKLELPERSVLRMLRPELGANPWEDVKYLNQLGDFTKCLRPENGLRPQGFQKSSDGREYFLAELAQFSQRMSARGVRVLFMAPELLVRPADLSNWANLYQNTRSQLEQSGAQWLNFTENEVFSTDPREFCDSPFHPNEQRATMNSQRLARQLSARN